jgi:hypothetical protein
MNGQSDKRRISAAIDHVADVSSSSVAHVAAVQWRKRVDSELHAKTRLHNALTQDKEALHTIRLCFRGEDII